MKKSVLGFITGMITTVILTASITGVLGAGISGTGLENIEVVFNNIKIYINGDEKTSSDEPFIYNDRTYVPLRFVSEALGQSVEWDADTNSVLIESIPYNFLSIFTNVDSASLLNFKRIDPIEAPVTIIFDAASSWESPSYHPYVRVFETSLTDEFAFAVVVGNQAIYYHNNDYGKKIIFTLLPNGNIQVEEHGLDFGLNGEYAFHSLG